MIYFVTPPGSTRVDHGSLIPAPFAERVHKLKASILPVSVIPRVAAALKSLPELYCKVYITIIRHDDYDCVGR